MLRAMSGVLVVASFSCLASSGPAAAQSYSPVQALLEREGGDRSESETLADPIPAGAGAIDLLHREARFVRTLQFEVPLSEIDGAVRDAEHLLDDFATANTAEAIWLWSRYRTLSGGAREFDSAVSRAWGYVERFPAYLEEGGDGPNGYYRVYNCAWALLSEAAYRASTGDDSHESYARDCARYILDNPLEIAGSTALINGQVTGFAAGALALFGRSRGDASRMSDARALAAVVKTWIESDPAKALGGETWAISGGAAFFGVAVSSFADDPASGRAWAREYAPYLDTTVPRGRYGSAFGAWYALGHLAAWRLSGERQQHEEFLALTMQLYRSDGDGDGGIPSELAAGDDEDRSWTTSFLAFMGVDPITAPVEVVVVPHVSSITPGSVLPYTVSVANNASISVRVTGVAYAFQGDGSPYGTDPVVGPWSGTLSALGAGERYVGKRFGRLAYEGLYRYVVRVDTPSGPVEGAFLFRVL